MRSVMVHCLSRLLPLYIVNEYPRSGGKWIALMLSSALGVPFIRDGEIPMLSPSLMHGHYLRRWGMRNVVVVWRDGRDVMVSWYHMCCFVQDFGLGPMIRKELPFRNYENVKENMPAFIEYTFTKGHLHPPFSWTDFVRRWHGRSGVTYVRYEDVLRDTATELQRIVVELTGKKLDGQAAAAIAEAGSFQNFSGRLPGQEDKRSFFRKGVAGDYGSYFNDQACQVFEKFAGSELSLLGYHDHESRVRAKRQFQ